jgi:hypothetical protein
VGWDVGGSVDVEATFIPIQRGGDIFIGKDRFYLHRLRVQGVGEFNLDNRTSKNLH